MDFFPTAANSSRKSDVKLPLIYHLASFGFHRNFINNYGITAVVSFIELLSIHVNGLYCTV